MANTMAKYLTSDERDLMTHISRFGSALIHGEYRMSDAARQIVHRIGTLSCTNYANHNETPCKLCGSRS